jgi:hypothetical protein
MPLVDINSSLSVREVDYIITRSGIIYEIKFNPKSIDPNYYLIHQSYFSNQKET